MESGIKKIVSKIKKDKDVIAVLLFGSYARNKKYARDVDLCVVLDKDYKDYKTSKKRLDYLKNAPDIFDIQIFQRLPLYVRISVLRDGKIIYLKNLKKLHDIAYGTIKEFAPFEHRYLDYINS